MLVIERYEGALQQGGKGGILERIVEAAEVCTARNACQGERALDLFDGQSGGARKVGREQGLGIGLVGGEAQFVLAVDGEIIAAEEGRQLAAGIIVQAQFLAERIGLTSW